MIILSDDDRRQFKSPAPTLPSLRTPQFHDGASASSVQLPDYEASQLETNRSPASNASNLVESPPASPQQRKGKLDGRLWKAVCYAFSLYLLLTVVLGIPFMVSLTQRFTSIFRSRTVPWEEGGPSSNNGQTPLDDINTISETHSHPHQCDSWTDMEYTKDGLHRARISALLSPSGIFELLSNTSMDNQHRSFGNLTIEVNHDRRVTQTVLSVDVLSSSEALREKASVCLYSSQTSQRLKLHLPTGSEIPVEDTLEFDIKLLFPQSDEPLLIKKLVTYLPYFTQRVGKLSPSVRFDKISLTGSGFDVTVNAMESKKIFIKNSEARIMGAFNVSEEIIIDNYEGPIHTNVTLYRGSRRNPPVTASLDTGNSKIEAAFLLQTAPSRFFFALPYTTPVYAINLKTFNAPIVSSILHHPSTPPTPPRIRVQNHIAPSTITVDSKYIGSFDVQSKLSTAHVRETSTLSSSFAYDHKSTSRTHGWVGAEPHCIIASTEITSSRKPVQLLFVEAETERS